jgi:flagellar biosynthesis regulator FlaF
LPSVTTPTAPNPQPNLPPQVQNPAERTWQQRSIELLNAAKAKIRTFTNTIPAKSQRFGKNVQIWAGYAKDYATEKIQAWREQH